MKIYKRRRDRFIKSDKELLVKRNLITKSKYVIFFFALTIFFYNSCFAAINTGLYGDDHYAGPFPIGFTFKYYNQDFNQFYVSTNGLIQFTNPTSSYINNCLPWYRNTLYVFWDDLRTDVSNQPTGTIEYELQGISPNRKLIVQWTNQYFFRSNLPMGTFQAILYENSNQIKYQYRYLYDDRSKGNSATIGINGGIESNTNYIEIGCNTANAIKPEQAILFTPNSDFSQYQVDTDADYNFIDISGLTVNTPNPTKRYSNQAPTWSWQKINTLNTYEIEIQDQSGNMVHREITGDVDHYTFIDGLQNGQSYRARIRGSINNGGTWEMWSIFSSLVTIDTIKPNVTLQQFNRVDNNTVKVTYSLNDNLSGIESGHLQIANNQNFEVLLIDQDIDVRNNSYLVENLNYENNQKLYARLKVTDRAGNTSEYTEPLPISSKAPTVLYPLNKSTINSSSLEVQGHSDSVGEVQIYLDGKKVGKPLIIDENGYFSQIVNLPKEGNYQLTAELNNDFTINQLSQSVSFDFKLPIPVTKFITPLPEQDIFAPIDIQVSAFDEIGIKAVEIFLDNSLFATFTEPPYQVHWPLTSQDNGSHIVKVKATNTNNKVAINESRVMVNIEQPAPLTAYTGKVTNINPKISYGLQPVTITGQAIYRKDSSFVANAPIKLVLNVNGFERRIATATDDNGDFSYTFIPQETDTGIYQVAVAHPDEKMITPQDKFEVDQIIFDYQNYELKVARNIATTIDLKATSFKSVKNLHWVLTADNQPNGSLPVGIKIESDALDISEGNSESINIEFIADDTASSTGSIYLVALADDSKDQIRGKLRINYQLGQAKPLLYAIPSYIQTGLQQGTVINANINLGNKGFANAENVQIQLVDSNNQPAPKWIFITTENMIESVAVNEQVPIHLLIQPDKSIPNGVYHFNLNVSANSKLLGVIPVSVSVTQNGEGSVQFDIADIYTATLNEHGQLITGVSGATIKLQNEDVLTEEYTIQSNEQGIALFENIPKGIYRYRVSAPNHMDVSGRINIRPDTTINEHVFLEYQIVNVEFNVTETTVKDIYDIELNATFNTQVPAPVVLIEPLSINLGYMQIGEEKVGELIITNYGLIEAQNIVLNLPQTDRYFKYEFFGELPKTLLPKEKRVIAYRVTALNPDQSKITKTVKHFESTLLRSEKKSNHCYLAPYSLIHESICANGDTSKGSSGGHYYKNDGQCLFFDWDPHGGIGNPFWIGGASPSPIPLAPGCSPEASCASGGEGSAGK